MFSRGGRESVRVLLGERFSGRFRLEFRGDRRPRHEPHPELFAARLDERTQRLSAQRLRDDEARRDEALPTAFVSDAEALEDELEPRRGLGLDPRRRAFLCVRRGGARERAARRDERSRRNGVRRDLRDGERRRLSSPTRHAEISTAATDFKNSMSSTASSAKSRRSLRTSSVPCDAPREL